MDEGGKTPARDSGRSVKVRFFQGEDGRIFRCLMPIDLK